MKGQTSFELLLVALIIVSVAMIAFQTYSEQATLTSAEAIIRSEADWYLTKAAFDVPGCAGIKLVKITEDSNTYTIHTNKPECTSVIFNEDATTRIQQKISYALGCSPSTEGECKGLLFTVQAEPLNP